MEEVSLKELKLEVAGLSQTEPEDDGLEEPEKDLGLTVAQEFEELARVRTILESRGEINEAERNVFNRCQRALRVKKVEALKQTTITDHFERKQKKFWTLPSTSSYPAYKHGYPFSREPWL